MTVDARWLKDYVRDIPDFPEPGIVFKDLTPLLGDRDAFRFAVSALAEPWADAGVTRVAGIEARGFILAAPVALHLGSGFIPVRKHGKLPWRTEAASYDLEYGSDQLEIHADAVQPGDQVLIIDDVIATGGTARASAELIERLGGQVVGFGFLLELEFLGGRARLGGRDVMSLVSYE
jgi:adenine phosphoribosyltransferase